MSSNYRVLTRRTVLAAHYRRCQDTATSIEKVRRFGQLETLMETGRATSDGRIVTLSPYLLDRLWRAFRDELLKLKMGAIL